MIDEQPSVRDYSDRELCRIVAAGLVAKSSSEIRKFAQSIGISLAELREVIQGAVPTIPSAEQTALLLERVVTATDPGWLGKLRERVAGWCFDANECGHADAEHRLSDLLMAVERRRDALKLLAASSG